MLREPNVAVGCSTNASPRSNSALQPESGTPKGGRRGSLARCSSGLADHGVAFDHRSQISRQWAKVRLVKAIDRETE